MFNIKEEFILIIKEKMISSWIEMKTFWCFRLNRVYSLNRNKSEIKVAIKKKKPSYFQRLIMNDMAGLLSLAFRSL